MANTASHKIALILELTDGKLREGIKAVNRVLGDLEKGARGTSDRAGAAMEGFETRVKGALGRIGGSTGAAAAAIGGLEGKTRSAAGKAASAVEGFERRAKVSLGRIGGSTQGVSAAFGALQGSTEDALADAGDAIDGFGKKTGGVLDRLLGPLANFKGQIVAAFGVAGFGAAVKSAGDFERKLADVATLLDSTSVPLERYREQILDLAGRSSRSVGEITEGLYDTISSGIPAIEGASGAWATLEASVKAASAGNAEVRDVVRTVTAVLNAYKGSGLTAAAVTDKLRVAVDKGVTTMPELAGSLGQILGISSGFKISFDEVLAVITHLTLQGLSTSEAITGLRQALVSMANAENQSNVAERMKALGFSMNLAKLESQGFIKTMLEMQEKTGATGEVINTLFTDIDGKKAILALAAGGFQNLGTQMEGIQKAAGATDRAAKIVSASFNDQWTILKNKLEVALIRIGEKALPGLIRGMESLGNALDGGAIDAIAGLATALANLAGFIAGRGTGILTFLGVLAAFKIPGAALAGIAALKTSIMGLVAAGGGVAAKAAQFGEGYALNYAGGFKAGLGRAAGGIGAALKGALKNPNILAIVAAVGVELGQALGDWIGKALADASPTFGKKIRDEIEQNTKDMERRLALLAVNAGFRDTGDMQAAQEKLKTGKAYLVKGNTGIANRGTPDERLNFRAEDVREVADALNESSQEIQAARERAKAEMAAAVGNLENEKTANDAQMEQLRAEATRLEAEAKAFQYAANNTLEGFGQAIVDNGNKPARELAKTKAKLSELEQVAISIGAKLSDAKKSQADFADGLAESERKATEAAGEASASVRERVQAQRDAAKAQRDQARQAKREADQARREREREAADAIRDLGKLQGDAMEAEGKAGIAFLESAIEAQEQAIEQARALGATALEDLDRAGGSVEEMAIEEQRGLQHVDELLREQIGLIEALRVKREAQVEANAQAALNAIREEAAARAKYLSPEARAVQQAEIDRLATASEKDVAAEVVRIRTDSARKIAALEGALREDRGKAELAFQRQLAEGTARTMSEVGFKEAGDEPPPPRAAAALRGLVGTIWSALTDGAQDVAEGLGDRIAKSAAYAAQRLTETGAYQVVEGYAKAAADLIADGGRAAADWLQAGAEKATDGLLRGAQFVLGDSLFSRIAQVVGQVSDATGILFKAVGQQVLAAGQAAAEIPGKLVAAGQEMVIGLTGALGAIGDNAAERLGDALVGFTTGISDALTAPLKELLGEDLAKYLSPILDLPANLLKQINGKLLQPALAAATAPFDQLIGGIGAAFSALTDPANTPAALKGRMAEVDAETAKRVEELTAAGRPDEAAKAKAEGAAQKADIQREFDKNQPEAVLNRIVEQASQVLQRVVQALPALVGTIIDTLIQEAPKFIEGIANAVAGILTTLAPKIGPLLTTLLNAILDAVPVIIDALVQAVPVIVDGLLKALIGLINRLPDLLTTILQGIIDLLPGLFQALADNLPGLIIAIVDAIPQLIMALVDALPQVLTALIEGVGQIVGALIEHLPEIIVAIVKALPQIIWALLKLVPLLVWALAKGLGLAVARIGVGLGKAGAKLGEWAASAGKTVYNYLTAAGRWVYQVLTSIGRGAKKAGSWLYDNTIGRFHSGGSITRGADPATAVRWAAAGARRFTDGGMVGSIESSMRQRLRGDEVPILAKLGEAVLNPRAAANMGQAEINARNAGAIPAGNAVGLVAQIVPDARGLDALLRLLIGQIVVTAQQPGSPMNRLLDRRAVPGARGVR